MQPRKRWEVQAYVRHMDEWLTYATAYTEEQARVKQETVQKNAPTLLVRLVEYTGTVIEP